MASTWEEVETARHESRHELVLSGPEVSQRIEQGGLDEGIFDLVALNFLEISKTSLSCVSPRLSNLSSLTNLVLHRNKLTTLPESIGELKKLKLLDVSVNELTELPPTIGQLQTLQTLNISVNKLSDVPDVSSLVQLHIFELSHNELVRLPAGICSPSLEHLAQILANANQLEELPPELSDLPSLRTLDVSDNKLTVIPPEISECPKLKEFRYGGNKLKDRRLARMIEQCSTKAILDYLRVILEKERKSGAGGGKAKDKKKKKKGKSDNDVDELTKNLIRILHFGEATGISVTVSDNVLGVRQYIVCCIVKHLNFNKSNNMLKRFFNLQTKLHDTSCKKRQLATIATHDLKAINAPLSYEARPPSEMKLLPLGKSKEMTADKLVKELRKEAEEIRKEKKRNTLSGIHQYLELLQGQQLYPCIVDSKGAIISFPPITNCESTKVTRETTDILVEVTSSKSLDACKKITEELLEDLLEMGLGCEQTPVPSGEEEAASGDNLPVMSTQILVTEQVKVTDSNGSLKVVFPSRVDLQSEVYRVERD